MCGCAQWLSLLQPLPLAAHRSGSMRTRVLQPGRWWGRVRGRGASRPADSPSPGGGPLPSPGLSFARARACVRVRVSVLDSSRQKCSELMEVRQRGTGKLQSSSAQGVARGRGAPSVGARAGRKPRRGNAGLMGKAGQIVMRMETVGAAFEGRF